MTFNEKENLKGVIFRVLESAFRADPDAIEALICRRLPCNEALADHQSVMVGTRPDGSFEVGLLGVLNGILFPTIGERIATVVKDPKPDGTGHHILGFQWDKDGRLEA